MFNHDPLHSGVSADTAIGASTAPGLMTLWSKRLKSVHDQGSPAVAFNASRNETLVYEVTYGGVASAFNASTGALVWQRTVSPDVDSSPAVYGNTVYFGDNGGTLEALNAATGAVRCTFKVPVSPPTTTRGRIIGSPVVGNVDGTGPTVFFGDAGVGSATEAQNGGHMWAVTGVGNTAGNCKQKWSYNKWPNKGTNGTMTGIWDAAGLAQESNGTWAVVFGTSNPDSAVYALNAVTGARLWRFQTVQLGDDEDVGAGPRSARRAATASLRESSTSMAKTASNTRSTWSPVIRSGRSPWVPAAPAPSPCRPRCWPATPWWPVTPGRCWR
jgi:outer membrane protein assembly factor BamB